MKAFPLSSNQNASRIPDAVPCPAYAPESSNESADNYRRVVSRLNARWRVIECRDGIQWILQRIDGKRRGRVRWTGRSYCRTRDGLMRACRDHAGEVDATATAVLESLPGWIGGRP